MGILRKSHKQPYHDTHGGVKLLNQSSRTALPASAWGADAARIDARQQEFENSGNQYYGGDSPQV